MQAVAAAGGGSLCCRRRGSEVVGERGIRAIRLNRTGDRGFIFYPSPFAHCEDNKTPGVHWRMGRFLSVGEFGAVKGEADCKL